MREAQAAAALDHPNVAAIYEVGEYQGRPYYSMQVVEGLSLKEIIAAKDLPIDQILEIGMQVCEGLQAAHEKGIIHRDIKPSNLLLDSHGRIRVVDFGLAAVVGSEQLTKTGSTLGTIGYMSPEQVRGQEVDCRSDLFSLGVVVYELLTKQNPFKRDSEAATLRAVSDDLPEPLARFKMGIPEGLKSVVEKALEKDAKTRYQHADEMRADLIRIRRLLESTNTPAPTARAGSRRKRISILTIAVLAVVAVAALMITRPWNDADPSKTPQKIMLAVLPFENLGSPYDEYFADGITDEIISKLTMINGIGVISRTSCAAYKGTQKSLVEIAHELKVNYILEGTIRWENNEPQGRVLIKPQLINATDDSHLWSDTYERELTGVFSLQSEIAENVASNLGIILPAAESRKLQSSGTSSTQAYLALLRGLAFARSNPTRENTDAAQKEFESCIRIDPAFARAWAELSMESSYKYHNWEKSAELATKAEIYATRAISLDPTLAVGRAAKGFYFYWCLGDYEKALEEFARAERLKPGDPQIMEPSVWVWRRQGRYDKALSRLTKLLELNPRDAMLLSEVAATFNVTRDYESAARYARMALSIDPGMSWAYSFLVAPALADSNLIEARRYLEATGITANNLDQWFMLFKYERNYQNGFDSLTNSGIMEYDGGDFYYPVSLLCAELLELGGDVEGSRVLFDSARVLLRDLVELFPEDPRYCGSLGLALAGLGRNTEAVEMGLKAVELCSLEHDALRGTAFLGQLAYTYVYTGEFDLALREFELLLAIPSQFNVRILQLDPRLDPLRDDSRFIEMIKKYARAGEG